MKKFWVFSMALALVAPMAVLSAGPVGAAGGTSCASQAGSATFKPGISTKSQNVTITTSETLSNCAGGSVVGGTSHQVFTDKGANCAGLAKLGTKLPLGTGTITWKNKTTSTVSETSVTGPKLLEATITGSVTAGTFKGGKISTVIAYTLSKGNCVKTPLTALTIKGLKAFVIT